jgi:general secretion pathway protein K
MIHRPPKDKGFALLIVLWVVSALAVMGLSLSFAARTETYGTLSYKESLQNRLLAECGVERAVVELLYRQAVMKAGKAEEIPVWRTDGTTYAVPLYNGFSTVRITDESGKIDINQLTDISAIVLKTLLINAGADAGSADIIADSILDWRDEDELHRLSGAESEYYMSLPIPYRAKNAPFDSVDELLLVRGVTPEILYGTPGRSGVAQFLTVRSPGAKINANVAPLQVLLAIPGITSESLQNILAWRESPGLKSASDLRQLMGDSYVQAGPYIAAGESPVFTVESTGYSEGGKKGFGVRAVVRVYPEGRYEYLYYKTRTGVTE